MTSSVAPSVSKRMRVKEPVQQTTETVTQIKTVQCGWTARHTWTGVVNRYPEIWISDFGSDIRIWRYPYDNRKHSTNNQHLLQLPWHSEQSPPLTSSDTVKHDTLPLSPPAATAATDICHIWVLFSHFSARVCVAAANTAGHPQRNWTSFYCISYDNSVRLSVTRRYCVKTTARSTVQFALLDSKMCLVL